MSSAHIREISSIHDGLSFLTLPQNAHAYVNGAFSVNLIGADDDSRLIGPDPCLLVGNMRPDFGRALETERFLCGKKANAATLKGDNGRSIGSSQWLTLLIFVIIW